MITNDTNKRFSTGSQQREKVILECPNMLCSVAPPNGNNKDEDNVPIVRRSNKVYRDPCEQETTEWVEREVMARVLSEMYPKKGWQRKKDEGREERGCLMEERGLPLTVDPGFSLPKKSLEKLVDEELREIIRHMIGW